MGISFMPGGGQAVAVSRLRSDSYYAHFTRFEH
jgi:hypothetical protein